MKKMISLFSVAVLMLHANVFAQRENDSKKKYEFEKVKNYSKSYNLSSSDKLSIDSKFGSVELHTWNKDEVKVDVEINVSAKTEEWAKAVLNDIEIEDSKSGNTVKFKTLFADDLDKKEGGSKHQDKYKKNASQTMEVNYQVYMPASNALDIDNEFGSTVLPDYKGEVDLTSKFGSLTTGSLTNVKNINVEFGSAKLGNIKGGNISIKYSSANVSKLSGNVKLNLEFSNDIVLNLDNSLDGLDVKASYSSVNLKPMGDLPASYKVFTSFGSFKNRTNIKFEGDDDDDDSKGPKFDFEYNGKSGSGNIPVKVKSSFSKIILGEPSEGDMKDKNKSKNKNKNVDI